MFIKSLFTNTNICTDLLFLLIYDKGDIAEQWGKDGLFKDRTWVNWIAIWKKKS